MVNKEYYNVLFFIIGNEMGLICLKEFYKTKIIDMIKACI